MSGKWETTGRIYGPHSLSVPLLDIRQGKQEVTPQFFLQDRGSPNDAMQVSGFSSCASYLGWRWLSSPPLICIDDSVVR